MFTLLRPTRKDPALQSRMHLVPPSARVGDLEFGLLLTYVLIPFSLSSEVVNKPKDQEYVRGYTATHNC